MSLISITKAVTLSKNPVLYLRLDDVGVQGPNLYANGSFDPPLNLQNWTPPGNGASWTIDSAVFKDGTQSARISTTSTGSGSWSGNEATAFAVVPGASYVISTWMKVSPGVRQSHFKILWSKNGFDNNLSSFQPADYIPGGVDGGAGGVDWTLYSETHQAPTDANFAIPQMMAGWWDGVNGTAATTWYDALVFRAVGIARDSSGSGIDGLVSASGVTQGVLGALPGDPGSAAMAFNGTTGSISIPGASNLDLIGVSYSAQIWLNRGGGGFSGYTPWLNWGGSGPQHSYFLADPNRHLWRWDGFDSGYVISEGLWYHIVYTFAAVSDISGTESVFVNGLLRATRAGTVPASPGPGTSWLIGAAFGGGHWFQGVLKECALFRTVLSPTDVLALYSAGLYELDTVAGKLVGRDGAGRLKVRDGGGRLRARDGRGTLRTRDNVGILRLR